MEKLYSRQFNVDFFEKDENNWIIQSKLIDDTHIISTEVEVAVPEMIIRDAKIHFEKYPLSVCPKIEEKAKKLIGLNLFKNYQWNSLMIFLGSKGCGNVLSILGLGLQSLIYTYYPHQIKIGKMTTEEWDKFMITKLKRKCLGHTLFEKNQAEWCENIRKV
jgi:hypothetical protein